MIFWILVAAILIGCIVLLYFTRPISEDSIIMINAGCGKGKSSTGIWTIYKVWKTQIKRWRIKKIKTKIFKHGKKKKETLKYLEDEKPYIYSNVPLFNVEYKKFTLEHLLREKRFEYCSTIYLNEASLIADSMLAYGMGKDAAKEYVNKKLQLFCKLIRQELLTNHVALLLETQNPEDLALAGDRVLSETFFILDSKKHIPFFMAVKLRKVIINMKNIQNNFNEDSTSTQDKWHLVPKKVFKLYDSNCYEFLTRNLPKDKVSYKHKVFFKKNIHKQNKPFEIITLTNYSEILESNEKIRKEKEENEITKQN